MVKNNYEKYEKEEEWILNPIRVQFDCGDCKEELGTFVEGKVNMMIYFMIGLLLWQVKKYEIMSFEY